MYFRPGQEVERNKELWHGNIWKESARFGQASITVAQGNFLNINQIVFLSLY